MQKLSRAMLVSIGMVLFISVAMHLLPWLSAACDTKPVEAALATNGSPGCAEFWLNRYQTAWSAILSVAGAFGVAWLALSGVRKQISGQAEANLVTRLGLEHQKIESLYNDQAQLGAARSIVAICEEFRARDWEGHNDPFANMVIKLRSQGVFPFDRIGPSSNSTVNVVDTLMTQAARLDDLRRVGQAPREWPDLIGSQFNRLRMLGQPIQKQLENIETRILDTQRVIKALEQAVRQI